MPGNVLYGCTDHVATITYNRPEAMNAVNGELRADLNAAFARFRDDTEAWVGIVTGAGRAFCAGADLKDPGSSAGEFGGTFFEKPTRNSFESGWEIYKPVIAAVNGHCLGIPAMVASLRLPQRVGWSDAMELLLTGETIDAERAREMGLVWRVVAHADLLAEARLLADRLVQGAPLAQRAMKEAAMRAPHQAFDDSVRAAETMRLVVGRSADAQEGLRAAAERRAPTWTGT
jgi:enoyl-CoA hydratase/carnithine racemase